MSHVVATIDEQLVNAVLAEAGEIGGVARYRGEEDAVVYGIDERELPSGFTIHYPSREVTRVAVWSVDLRWSVRNLRAEIEESAVRFRAELRAEARDFSYTNPIEGIFGVRLDDGVVHLRLRPVPVTLHIEPLGQRLEMETFDLAEKLPEPIRHMRFELPIASGGEVSLPGGEALAVAPRRFRLSIETDHIAVRATLDTRRA